MSYSIQERAYFDQLFAAVDNQDSGVLAGQDALPLLMVANLPQQTLGEIWAIADPDNNGFLTRESWYKAARLVGWLQKGGKTTVDEALTSQAGPLPTFQGHAPPPVTPQATGPRLPPLSPADRAKFTKIFVGCGPSNGLVSGDKARDVFVKSQLDYDKLGQIWNLADTQGRGSLDLTDFIIGMYLIQSCMANPALALPAVLPPGTYEAASGGRGPASPIVRQNTGPASPQYRQPTPVRGATWDVTTEAKNTSDRFFEQLDTQNRGYIEGDVAVPFMLQSQLDEGTLAAIWDLADIRKEGKLNKDEFAVAMHLINAKLAGRDPPATLPTSLVPPSLRNEPTQPPQTSAAKDLFDLFADEPIGPSLPSQAPPPPVQTVRSPIQLPQVRSPQIKSPQLQSPQVRSPQADLMGEEDQPIADNSAEIGNKRNQLENTNRGLDSMQKERPGLEKAATSGADELKELEDKLIAARSKHESESKAVAELKARVSEQKDKIQSVNMDYIAAQSDVSALQSERDELEQALLAGKEEVRDLNKRMKEIAEEKSGLLLLLEKLKKETRQQKGMVSIAKKQLATAEGGRDSVQGEIRALEATPEATEAAAVPLPSTPRALSPATSQRSNNPFDRFREGAKSPAGVLGAGALIGAAAGVVVAGAETLYEAAKDVVSPDEAKSEADQVHEFAEHVREPKQATDFDSAFAEYGQEGLPSGIPKSAIPYLRADERSASTQAVRGDSMPESPASTVPGVGESSLRNVADDSSDEDEGPEDVEAIKYRSDNTPILYPPVAQVEAPKSRRSAPPPPPRTVERLDPFGENSDAGEDPASATFDPSGAETVPATVHAQSDLFGASDVARNVPVPTGAAPRENDVFDTVQGVAVKSDSSRAPESAESRATPAGAPLAGETDALGSMQDDGAQSDPFDASLDHVKPETDPVGPAGGQTDPFGALQGTTQSDPFGLPLQGAPAPTKLGFDDDEFASMGQPKSTVEAPAAVGDAGKPEQVLPPGAAPAVKSGFDDDDFDFSDAPPVQMNVPPAPMNAKAPAKDDFDFDDEFEQPSNSDGSKSYEMVSPPSGGLAPPIPQTDAWGMQAPPTQPSSAFSFDDAFGENSLNPPTLPERRESGVGAQPDDIEDVKKLCAMGFPRSLVIEALGANGYDFQKTLNVLLQ